MMALTVIESCNEGFATMAKSDKDPLTSSVHLNNGQG
jgi:hypothetical protein